MTLSVFKDQKYVLYGSVYVSKTREIYYDFGET